MTEWYYRDAFSRKIGPLSTEEFEACVTEGEIQPRTRVWRSGMLDWTTYEDLLAYEANCLALVSGPTVCAAPRSRSYSTVVALGYSAVSRPPGACECDTSAATPHPILSPALERCTGGQEVTPANLFRAERERLRRARGADANWLGKYFVRLALAAGAFLAIRFLLTGMDGGHPAAGAAWPEDLALPSIAPALDPAAGGGGEQ